LSDLATFWIDLRLKATNELAFFIQNKFLKIPADLAGHRRICRLRQEGKKWSLIVGEDFNFSKKWKSDFVLPTFCVTEFFNFLVGAGFLTTKIITRKSEDDETLGLIFFKRNIDTINVFDCLVSEA